ncbi:hypothetical protein DY000_02027434 [Brassica cretica]|uniref:RING-type E3 ubiquitin transferase n=1 Tax=Brassica cretica TaxID=69181 RepID=A0ABQ7EFG6_BRACR|nr:hypothetical protein DY000_02027434 [Brassica cretica]
METESMDCESYGTHHFSSTTKTHAVVTNIVGPAATSVYELLECPVCTFSMYPPLHQCQNGHTFCSTCKVRVHNRFPTCRQELGDIRCLALEKVAESLELPCKYFNLGCPEIFPYYSKLKHESVCNFRPYGCPYTLAPSVLGMGPVYMAFLRFMGDEEEARRYSYSLEVGGSGRKLTWEGTPRSIRDSHRKVRDSNDGLIIERNMALFFSGGDRKELKLRVTGKIWKELHSADSGVCMPNMSS